MISKSDNWAMVNERRLFLLLPRRIEVAKALVDGEGVYTLITPSACRVPIEGAMAGK